MIFRHDYTHTNILQVQLKIETIYKLVHEEAGDQETKISEGGHKWGR